MVYTPYTTSKGLFVGAKPSWIPNEIDLERAMSYITYEEIYWNVPDVLKVSLRGSNEQPLYVPSAMAIVDTTNRYTAPGFGVSVIGAGPQDAVTLALEAFLRRERFRSKFAGAKRYGIMRGDWVWHMTADETKSEGSRISLTSIDPGMYFPIVDDEDVDSTTGCHLVDYILDAQGNPSIHRVTYRKAENGRITVEEGLFRPDKWEGPSDLPYVIIQPETELPEEITALPVYHIKNTEEPGNPFGSSDLRGLERLIGGLNQVMSDEDLALALEGIGVYATDASQPIDKATGQEVPWRIGPGRVVHYDGSRWDRVQGVSGLNDSYGAHYDRIWDALKKAAATPDIALGSVDVSVASSGIALALQLGPMLAKAGEKDQIILDVHNQMFYDWWNGWMPAYEGTNPGTSVLTCTVGSAVPVDRAARFTELNDMLDRSVIDAEYYRVEAGKLGYVFPDGMSDRVAAERKARASESADPFTSRLNDEVDDSGESA